MVHGAESGDGEQGSEKKNGTKRPNFLSYPTHLPALFNELYSSSGFFD